MKLVEVSYLLELEIKPKSLTLPDSPAVPSVCSDSRFWQARFNFDGDVVCDLC
jgi:hypothetical protein